MKFIKMFNFLYKLLDKKLLDNSEEKGLIEERCTDCLYPGNRIHIEDITSSKI